jgi:hypothetical protein
MGKKAKQKELVVEIEVGGDHGDGNVELIKKSKGVRVIIRDFDNARLDEENPDGDTIPQEREWEADVSV